MDTSKKLELAIKWNQYDDAKETLDKSTLDQEILSKLLKLALIEKRANFVNLMLENETDLRSFLTKGNLKELYNNQIVFNKLIFLNT